jgi:hypothetical protein
MGVDFPVTDTNKPRHRTPVFDAETGELRYVITAKFQGSSIYIPFMEDGEMKNVELEVHPFQFPNGVMQKMILADANALRALDTFPEFLSWLHRIP